MTTVNAFMNFLFVVIAFKEVASWTYDLDEVRKFFDEQQRKEEYWREHGSQNNDESVKNEESGYEIYGNHFNRGIHSHSYHDHRNYEHMNIHNKYNNMHRDSHHSYGSPKHVKSYFDHGLNHESQDHYKQYTGESKEYAKAYGYDSYMGRKLHGIMRNGTRYLEGLRLAVENFKRTVENCSRATVTPFPGLRYNGTAPGMELFNSSRVMGLDSVGMQWPQIFDATTAMLGANNSNPLQRARDAIPGSQMDTSRCENATHEREHVRRLADLSMHTVRQLQDLAMKKPHKGHNHEEIELVVRLAWFLERLAHITGFDPEAENFTPTESSQTTTAVFQNPLALNVSDAVKKKMMDCLKENSSVPATVRCNIPVEIPSIMRMIFNISEISTEGSPMLSNPAPELVGSETNPLMPTAIGNPMTVENNPISNLQQPESTPEFTSGPISGSTVGNQMSLPQLFSTPELPPLSVVGLPDANPSGPPPLEAIETAATDPMSNLAPFSRAFRSIRKRSTNDPMLKVMKYFVKRKLWAGSNMETNEAAAKDMSVDNNISFPKILKNVDEINDRNVKPKFMARSDKSFKSVQKRSVKYNDWVVSRQSEDPQQDISYYLKNKPGTNKRTTLVGAAQARLALERIFQTGNIEVVRRYGANYNPLIPSPFLFGVAKTLSDI